MGRRPNPLILEFFERGAKLNDNSNRYRHSCKACGEVFPKGRIDSLVAHLTKKCPAISEAQRINACLTLHGINSAAGRQTLDRLSQSTPGPSPGHGPDATPVAPNQNADQNPSADQSQIWTPLETLAEVSRQIEASEKHDDLVSSIQDSTTEAIQTALAAAVPLVTNSNPFEVQEQFTLENPPMTYENGPDCDKKGSSQLVSDLLGNEMTEEKLRQLLQTATSASQSAISVAAAATARLHPSLLDPQLLTEQDIQGPGLEPAPSSDMVTDYPPAEQAHLSPDPNPPSTPWGGVSYVSDSLRAPATVDDRSHHLPRTLNKGGYRMDTVDGPDGPHHRHSRARFDSGRRREVQEVRRIGACIRCRILRKTCSKGTPCDTCKKVLSPRVWRTGCIRTKLSEYIDLYSAGVQIVMAQKRINSYKSSHTLQNVGAVIEASHFPETGHTIVFQVLQGFPNNADQRDIKTESSAPIPVLLLDNNNEDIPGKVEAYMRDILVEFIRREPSHHVRVTLEAAMEIAAAEDDELLKRSLELWGIVEMMDRERQWTMLVKSPRDDQQDHWISDETESEAYTNICMQLTAAAERKAAVASKNLLNGIQRHLQDGKVKMGFPMFLTIMLFLNCMEKTTWAFKAWDEENLRPKWPLEKPPSNYTDQGHGLTELLRMLLVIRHILPKTIQRDPDAVIVADEEDPAIVQYFCNLSVTPSYLHTRLYDNNFQPTDSRSLEFLFCAPLLLRFPAPQPNAAPQALWSSKPQLISSS